MFITTTTNPVSINLPCYPSIHIPTQLGTEQGVPRMIPRGEMEEDDMARGGRILG